MMILVGLRWLDTLAGIDLGVPKEQFGADAAVKVLDGPYTSSSPRPPCSPCRTGSFGTTRPGG